MWIAYGLSQQNTSELTGLTIGAFDGVHLGHQALIRWFVTESHRAGLQAVVLTFDPLPRQVLTHHSKVARQIGGVLSVLEERLACIASLEVDGVVVLSFDRALAATPALDFVTHLGEHLSLRGFWVGSDFSLGKGRGGNITFLRELGRVRGFDVHVFEQVVLWNGAPVRSSRIRRALRAGDVEEACGCLGRPYRLSAPVGYGDQRGRTLGFPTANLVIPEERLLPANGVYICHAHVPQGCFHAITNVGTRPTFNHRPPTVEAHLLDFSANLYDMPLQLDFLHRLRPEIKFSSAEALVAQMHKDEADARAWLQEHDLKHAQLYKTPMRSKM